MKSFTNSLLYPAGIDLFCTGKKFLVYNMVSRNLKIKYRRSVLGIFWTLLNPLALATIYYFVFKVVMNVQLPNYLPFILSGVLPWAFFSQSVSESTESFVANAGLLTKVPVPIQVFPYVGVLTNFVTLVLATPIILVAAWLHQTPITAAYFLFPFYGLALFAMAYSASIVLAISFVYFRDLKHLVGLILQIWFYASPIVYREQMIPEKYRWILFFNPLGQIFEGIHSVLLDGQAPSVWSLATVCFWVFVFLAVALFFQKRLCRELVESL
ncbi:MAG: ABC transporter permease [Bdellovibrionales bacterium]|nr:ABC transporter permease [Bdellovibrionales bacterium]